MGREQIFLLSDDGKIVHMEKIRYIPHTLKIQLQKN